MARRDGLETSVTCGPQLDKIRRELLLIWNDDTAFNPHWNPKTTFRTKSRGQCYVTALLLKRLLGGEIYRGRVGNEAHYWNYIEGEEVDLTSDQYGGDGIHPITKRTKTVKSLNWNNDRFLLLWERWERCHGIQSLG